MRSTNKISYVVFAAWDRDVQRGEWRKPVSRCGLAFDLRPLEKDYSHKRSTAQPGTVERVP